MPPEDSTIKTDGGEPTWDADTFLKILARRTGKLLKGGEPDRETVSKMVLNDWIRGKIPFFVRPPDREDGAFGSKGKERKEMPEVIEGEKKVKGVQQPIKQIVVTNRFVGEDIETIEEEEEEWNGIVESEKDEDEDDGEVDVDDDDDEEDGAGSEDDAVEGDETENAAPEEELGWDDVFDAVAGGSSKETKPRKLFPSNILPTSSNLSNDSGPPTEEDPEETKRRPTTKEPRMKTNKVRIFCQLFILIMHDN